MSATAHRLDLPALDGANPLGFLAALGTLFVLSETEGSVKLGWRVGSRWTPFLQSIQMSDEVSVVGGLAKSLRGNPIDPAAEQEREAAQKCFDAAKKKVKDAEAGLRNRKLRGAEREAARKREVEPLLQTQTVARDDMLAALKQAVPSPELALGQRPDCTIAEFCEHASSMLRGAHTADRRSVDLLASFGTEVDPDPDQRIVPTPFCFITGSGHQWFLDTARQLMGAVSETKIHEALFQPWGYRDEKLTMRWDPVDDRRYALMDRDPTASDNKSTTVWMANLLAYRALAFFPCAPSSRGLSTPGWIGNRKPETFTWPIWEPPLSADTIPSLLCHPAFGKGDFAVHRHELRARGVAAIYRARRIQVGNPPLHKLNFSIAEAQ